MMKLLTLAALTALTFGATRVAFAAIIGYHDATDPAKTMGWACSTDSPQPLRVRLYADIDGTMKLLDTQLADKRRDDLASVCGGAFHSFRFSDYATTTDGIALYGRASPVSISVYAETATGLQRISGSPRSTSFAAVGLWDPGLVNGRWRTDFDNPQEGASQAPVLLGECVFTTPLSDGYSSFSGGGTDDATHCRYGSIISPASNAATSDATWPRESFWVVTGNVEPAFGNPLCANGPPGQSLPFKPPGSGSLFGVAALPDGESSRPARRKMHLVLNSWTMTDCRTNSYAIPYLAVGAQADRGNNGVITYLNRPGAKTSLAFGMTLMDLAERNPAFGASPDGSRRYRQSHVLIEATWGGRKRWLFIELLPDARRMAEAGGVDAGIDAHIRFNWHMTDSFIHPGADYIFKSAALLSSQCKNEGVVVPAQSGAYTYVDAATRPASRIDYRFDLQRVFDCLQRLGTWGAEPMPAHAVPVTGIHFGIETDDRLYRGAFTGVTAPNALWIALDNVVVE